MAEEIHQTQIPVKILKPKQLYLGNPSEWPDKNDSELVELYSEKSGVSATRATCLTSAPDRFHFWAIFGEYEKGVCLWFDEKALLKGVCEDTTVKAGQVNYTTISKLKELDLDQVPFTKRAQYADEREFRVIRDYVSVPSHEE